MNYFTSDIHFCDITTLKADCRPFKSINQFDKYIIKLWNKTAKKNDTIYVVGDLLDCDGPNHFSWHKALKYIKKIKANIVLIMGNNEQRILDNYFDSNFNKFKNCLLSYGIKDVVYNLDMSFKGNNFHLVHNPIDYKKNYVNLVGHSHRSKGIWYLFGLSVSCDLNHYRLYSEDDIIYQLDRKDQYMLTDPLFKLL